MIKFKGGFKRIYGLVAFLVCVLTFLLIPLGKSSAIVVTNNGIMNRLFFMDRNTNKQILTAVKRDTAGVYIYCGEEQKDSPSGQDMWKDGTYNYQAYTLLSNGYPHRSFTGDPETDYFITQMAFWALVDPGHVNLDKLDAYVDYSKRDDVWNHAKWLYDLAKSAPENYTFSVGFNKGAINCVREGDNFVSDWITLEGSPGIDMESVHFSASNGVYCAYQLRNGNLVPDVPINMEFRVIVPVSQTQGSCTITATGNIRKPVVNRLTCNDPAVQKVAQYQKELEPYSSNFNLTWPTNGDLEIVKTDADTGAALQGAVFEVRKDGVLYNNTVLTTGANGKTPTVSLPAGNYTIVETQAPSGYVIDSTPKNITIQASNKTSTPVTNTKSRGKLKIIKKDADTNALLANAQFKVYKKANNQLVATLTTNANGEVLSGELEVGDYYIQETVAPSGYVLNSNRIDFSITTSTTIVTKEVTNKKIQGRLKITKTDGGNGKLAGAEFKIYRKADNVLVETLVTGNDGTVTSSLISYGDYYFQETKAPTGYVIDSTKVDFSIRTNGEVINKTVVNIPVKGKIRIVKTDSNTGAKLAGAVFKLYKKSDDSEVATVTTNAQGFGDISDIPYGEYYVKEITAPNGYVLDSSKKFINITENGKTYEISAPNTLSSSSIRIIKTKAGSNDRLSGATFKIFDANNNLVKTVTTGSNGEVSSGTLPLGTYKVQEVTAPVGYVLDSTPKNVVLNTQGSPVDVEFADRPISGFYRLVKKDSENQNVLQGAVFTIYDATTNAEVQTITTDKNGVATSSALTYGSYYAVEKTAPTGYNKSNQRYNFDIDTDGRTYEQVVTNEPVKGRIKIVKKDKDNPAVAIAGAVFKILDKAGTEVARLTTGNDGTVTSDLLRYGDYTVQEITASAGYVLDDTPQTVNIRQHDNTYTVEFINEKVKGKLKVIKTDGKTITKLAGAEFTVYEKATNKEYTKIVTNKDGEALTGWLPYGEYYFKETKAPEGYALDGTIREFNVDTSAKVYQFKIDNEKITSRIKILKTDEETGVALKGAVFGVYKKSNNSKVLELTIGNDGTVTSEPIEFGEYYIKEIKAPKGYTLNTRHYDFTVTTHGAVIEIPVTNRIIKGRVKIKKVDEETNKTLKGAIFAVYKKADDTEVCRLTTGDDGTITSGLLNYGEYYLKEVQPPTGYNLNNERVDFSITEEGKVYEFTAENRIIKGRIKIIKTDIETNNVLKGGVFQIFNANYDSLVCEVTTGDDGTVTTDLLNYGNYYVKEKTPPVGYTLNSNRFNVEIREEGKVYPVEVGNRIIKGRIKIIKSDEETGAKLENAKFELFTKDNVKLADLVTDANGEVTTDLLNYGEYYVKEKEPPVGYNINPNKFTVNITEDGKVYEVQITNRIIKGKLEIIKLDAENLDRLEGAVFKIYSKVDNREMATLTTNKDGELLSPLLNYGDYYFKEITPPEGFLLNTNAVDFSIREEGKVYSFNVTNNPIKGKITIDKKDNDLKDLDIPGVEFEIRNKDNLVATLVTDENGHAETDWLRYGEYEITEKKPKEGYIGNVTVHKIFIKEHNKIYPVNINNQIMKGKIQIVKIDENHEEKPVEGAEFTIYAEDVFGINKGTEVTKVITDKDGFAVTEDLRYGIYKIVETKTPEGYFKSDREYFINIKENNKTYIRYISNKPIESKILVSKKDNSTGEPLEGVKFEIRNQETKEPLTFTRLTGKGKAVEEFTEFETGEDGTFLTPQAVPFGKWELVEKQPLYDYVGIEPVAFSMDETTPMEDIEGIGTITDMDLTNSKIEGKLELTKLFSPTEIDGNEIKYTNPVEFYKMRNKGFVEPEDFNGEDYPLAYATFNLYKLSCEVLPSNEKDREDFKWELLGEYETNLDGKLIIDGLEYGAYKLEEVKTPDNFKEVEDVYFDIVEDGDVFKTTLINEVKTGDVEITKLDIHDGTLLPNAHFEILDKDKNVVLSGITDENGLFKFKLSAGKYYYKETQAPVFEGTEYILDEGEYPFEIKEDGEIVKCKAPNKKKVTPKTSAMGVGGLCAGIGVFLVLVITFMIIRNKRK